MNVLSEGEVFESRGVMRCRTSSVRGREWVEVTWQRVGLTGSRDHLLRSDGSFALEFAAEDEADEGLVEFFLAFFVMVE